MNKNIQPNYLITTLLPEQLGWMKLKLKSMNLDLVHKFLNEKKGSSSLNKLAGYEKIHIENESKKYVLNFKEFCLRESLMRLLNSKGFTNNFYNLGGSTIEKSKNKICIYSNIHFKTKIER